MELSGNASQETTQKQVAEKAFAAMIIGLLQSEGIELTGEIALACFGGAIIGQNSKNHKASELIEQEQKRKHRDGLHGQEQIDYVLGCVKKCLIICAATFQDKIVLPVVFEGQEVPENLRDGRNSLSLYREGLEDIFVGTSEFFRKKVIAEYRANMLPELLTEEKEEKEQQAAIDEFIALINNKTSKEIRAITKLLIQTVNK